ncbi:ribonuclease HII [bacterium]|nr:ribonuclease HII [bacterium]
MLSSDKSPFAGVDEAGRGPLAGPVVAAAVVWDYSIGFDRINDSKALTTKRRLNVFEYILENARAVEISIIPPSVIDGINIKQSSLLAMRLAISKLTIPPRLALIDGIDKIPGLNIEQVPVIHGDRMVKVISAASVVAKVVRDSMMESYAAIYPGYHFDQHKGYPTSVHKSLLERNGITPIHRTTYRGVKHLT